MRGVMSIPKLPTVPPMTLREYYAGLFMQAIITHEHRLNNLTYDKGPAHAVSWVLGWTDALIAELDKGKNQ